MDTIVALIFLTVCLLLLARMWRRPGVLDFQLGVIAAFSVGYFVLPIFFRDLSPLRNFTSGEVAVASLIFLLFFVAVLTGAALTLKLREPRRPIKMLALDEMLLRHRKVVASVAFSFYMFYYFTQDLTSYSAANFDSYFVNRGALSAAVASLADLAVALIAVSLATAYRQGRKRESVLYLIYLSTCVSLLVVLGQRLVFITPIMITMAAFVVTGQHKVARRVLALGVLALLLISPLAIAVRQAPSERTATQVIGGFTYGASPVDTIFQSIVDRSDLLYVTVRMKPRIDNDPIPGITYYESVLVNPIPSFMFPGTKPYLLSTNGEASGELSSYAWRSLVSTQPGSLSAFGGLVAYRELGWAGVLLNGLATGALFVALARRLALGGFVSVLFYCTLFVNLSIRKVPTSFWEAVAAIMPLLPIFLALVGIDQFLRKRSVAVTARHRDANAASSTQSDAGT